MILIYIALIITILILIWHFTTRAYQNPYIFTFYFGRKGAGKSTLLTKLAYEYLKKGKKVYSTEYIKFDMEDKKKNKVFTLETIPIVASDIPYTSFPPESVILIDEASLIWSNRDFADKKKKDTLKAMAEFMQLQRRHKLIIHMFSVSFDVDKKIRDQCDEMRIVTKFARVFVFAKRLIRKPIVVHPVGDSPATIQEDILSDPVIFYPFGGLMTAFIPRWSKFYKSYLTDGLNVKEEYATIPGDNSTIL